jgi:hypothetical protein
MREALTLIGHETLLSDGTRIIVESFDDLEIDENPSDISQHEAWHALAALLLGIGVEYLTNIPEGNTAGHTKVEKFHPIAAAAAHAMGCSGGGHDLKMIRMSGNNVNTALMGARTLLSGERRKMLAIATALDKKKTLGGNETLAIVKHVNAGVHENAMALVRIIAPDGKESQKKVQKLGEKVLVPVEISRTEVPKPISLGRAA